MFLVHTSDILYSFSDALISPLSDLTHGSFLWPCGKIVILTLHALALVWRSEYEDIHNT